MVSEAPSSRLVARESFLPAMSVVTTASSLFSPSCSITAVRKSESPRGADPNSIKGSFRALV